MCHWFEPRPSRELWIEKWGWHGACSAPGMHTLPRLRRPPFCPNPTCHHHQNPTGWRYKKNGFFRRQARPRKIQRYRCSRCHRNFSSQTFHLTYWLHHNRLLVDLFQALVSCSGLRQFARSHGLAHATVVRHTARLGRHCLLFQARAGPSCPEEPVGLDGFRTLEAGHYWPFDAQLMVGVSHYVYGFNDAELRRSGAMRPGQKRHRARLEARYGRPDPRATEKAVAELVARVVPRGHPLVLRTDEHPDYPRGLGRLRGWEVQHETTSSRAARTARNPLFPINLADLLIRHGGANHKRETIAFSKRRQGAMSRMAIWQVWRNFVKPTSENRGSPPPAVALGLQERALTVPEILGARLFATQIGLWGWLRRCYEGRIPTRRFPRITVHRCTYAY